jgi:hypothetical protein
VRGFLMNTEDVARIGDWDEDEMADAIAAFVRRERRFPSYTDLVALRGGAEKPLTLGAVSRSGLFRR